VKKIKKKILTKEKKDKPMNERGVKNTVGGHPSHSRRKKRVKDGGKAGVDGNRRQP